jgi:hypothetical protein
MNALRDRCVAMHVVYEHQHQESGLKKAPGLITCDRIVVSSHHLYEKSLASSRMTSAFTAEAIILLDLILWCIR